MAARSNTTASSPASAPEPAAPSRCFRPERDRQLDPTVVQRVPVRIALDASSCGRIPADRLSMEVSVDTHDRAGDRLPKIARSGAAYETHAFAHGRVATAVAQIIAANSDRRCRRWRTASRGASPLPARPGPRRVRAPGPLSEALEAAMADQAPPRTRRSGGGTLAFGTLWCRSRTFMNVLDVSIANVSIPAIAGDLGVSSKPGNLGHHLVRGRKAISVPLTVAVAALRQRAAFSRPWCCS